MSRAVVCTESHDSLLGGPSLWQYFPIYIIGPIIGTVAAAFFYDGIVKE
jgi:glycerol uptake facilitator protein